MSWFFQAPDPYTPMPPWGWVGWSALMLILIGGGALLTRVSGRRWGAVPVLLLVVPLFMLDRGFAPDHQFAIPALGVVVTVVAVVLAWLLGAGERTWWIGGAAVVAGLGAGVASAVAQWLGLIPMSLAGVIVLGVIVYALVTDRRV